MICPYCGDGAEKIKGDVLYGHRPDLRDRTYYRCPPCDAHVGCHVGTEKPMGRLANAELRKWKSQAHRLFDQIWRDTPVSRGEAYLALSQYMGIAKKDCHIGMFDIQECRIVCKFAKMVLDGANGENQNSG